MMTFPRLSEVVSSVNLRLPRDDEHDLEWYDHTALSAVNTCPTWGVIHNVLRKTFNSNARAMALEAGSASHEVYAAVRLWDMRQNQGLWKHAFHSGCRIFGEDRYVAMEKTLSANDDDRTAVMKFALQALYDSGFFDDPRDKRRTMANIEQCLIAYIDKWPFGLRPVWVQDEDDPQSLTGIEIPVNFVVEFVLYDRSVIKFRYTGRADGLHWRNEKKEELEVHENKTASRLDEGWQRSFEMLHSITGYLTGVSLIIGKPLDAARVFGMAIPLPKGFDFGGLYDDRYLRKKQHFNAWINWLWYTTRVIETFRDNIDEAPRYTHSCNRYFRPCSFIPYCTGDDEERAEMLDEMVDVTWNPLHDKVRD